MRLLILIATAMIAVPGVGSAQSVLERVLGQIDGASNLAQVSGVYANIAESVGSTGTTTTENITGYVVSYVPTGFDGTGISVGDFLTQAEWDAVLAAALANNISSYVRYVGGIGLGPGPGWYSGFSTANVPYSTREGAEAEYITEMTRIFQSGAPAGTGTVTTTTPGLSTTVDGSITNIITGVTSAMQEAVAGVVTATEFTLPTFDLGDMATTALGAVNTGEITLGVNSAVDEASTSTTNAISATMTQIGGSADTGALVLNVAHNASAVNGASQNTMIAVNGSIGSASTTALGAVNTGAITSGVNAAVQGIVGMSGQASSGL